MAMTKDDFPTCETCQYAVSHGAPDGLLWCAEGASAPEWMTQGAGYDESTPEHVVPDFGCIHHSDLEDDGV
jgi:hypothetical protein